MTNLEQVADTAPSAETQLIEAREAVAVTGGVHGARLAKQLDRVKREVRAGRMTSDAGITRAALLGTRFGRELASELAAEGEE
jgi:hypothetical protein